MSEISGGGGRAADNDLTPGVAVIYGRAVYILVPDAKCSVYCTCRKSHNEVYRPEEKEVRTKQS